MSGEVSARPRVLLLGLGPTAHAAFGGLLSRFAVVALLRGDDDRDEAVRTAAEHDVPVLAPGPVEEMGRVVDELAPEAVVVSSFDRILPARLVQARPFLNVHYAPLPANCDRATVNSARSTGDSTASITIYHLVPGLDAGPVLYRRDVPIGPRSTVTELCAALNDPQRSTLPEALEQLLTGDRGEDQGESAATYACGRVPGDGELVWSGSTGQADRLVPALTPSHSGAFTWLGLERVTALRVEPVPGATVFVGRVPGRVVRVARSEGFVDVLTGDGVLRVHEVRPQDGPAQPTSTVVTSLRQTLGRRVVDLVSRLHALESPDYGPLLPSPAAHGFGPPEAADPYRSRHVRANLRRPWHQAPGQSRPFARSRMSLERNRIGATRHTDDADLTQRTPPRPDTSTLRSEVTHAERCRARPGASG